MTVDELLKRKKEVKIDLIPIPYDLKAIREFGKIQQSKIDSLISVENDNGYIKKKKL